MIKKKKKKNLQVIRKNIKRRRIEIEVHQTKKEDQVMNFINSRKKE
jgi:hypothetical protein